jgi:hypothetical protein
MMGHLRGLSQVGPKSPLGDNTYPGKGSRASTPSRPLARFRRAESMSGPSHLGLASVMVQPIIRVQTNSSTTRCSRHEH